MMARDSVRPSSPFAMRNSPDASPNRQNTPATANSPTAVITTSLGTRSPNSEKAIAPATITPARRPTRHMPSPEGRVTSGVG